MPTVPTLTLSRLLLGASLLLAAATNFAASAPPEEFWYGTNPDGQATVRLHFFYTPTCPHCQAAQPFVTELQQRLP